MSADALDFSTNESIELIQFQQRNVRTKRIESVFFGEKTLIKITEQKSLGFGCKSTKHKLL